MRDMIAVVLPSGTGVRFQDLSPSQVDAVLLAASEELPPTTTSLTQLTLVETRLGVEAMVKEVTVGPCVAVPDEREVEVEEDDPDKPGEKRKVTQKVLVGHKYDVNHPENKWVKFNPEKYDEMIANGKDWSTIKTIYSARNRVSPGEVALIMGKAVTVATP